MRMLTPVRSLTGMLVLAMGLGVGGCRSLPGRSAPQAFPLAQEDVNFARALAHFSRGLVYEGELPGAPERALEQFAAALSQDPRLQTLYTKVAHASLRLGQADKAINVLQQACAQAPRSAVAQMELAAAYQLVSREAESRTHYARAVELDPRLTFPYLALAALYFKALQDDRALEILGRGMRQAAEPAQLSEFCRRQGVQLFKSDQISRAIPCFEFLALYEAKERRDIYFLVAELYAAQQRDADAVRYLTLAIQQPDPVPDAFIKLALLQRKQNQAQALATLESALKRFPDNALLYQALGECYSASGKVEEAVRALTAATQRTPPLVQPYLALAAIHVRHDQLDRATATLEDAARRLPNDLSVLFLLATVHNIARRHTAAIAVFEKLAGLAARTEGVQLSGEFYINYGGSCEQADQFEKAGEILQAGINRYPQNDELLNYVAYMWAERGVNLDKALGFIQRALVIDPNSGAYRDTLGWIHYQRRDYAKAHAELERAGKLLPDDPVVNDHRGDVLLALEQEQAAIACWKQSLQADPANEKVAAKLKARNVDVEALRREAARQPTQPAGAEGP